MFYSVLTCNALRQVEEMTSYFLLKRTSQRVTHLRDSISWHTQSTCLEETRIQIWSWDMGDQDTEVGLFVEKSRKSNPRRAWRRETPEEHSSEMTLLLDTIKVRGLYCLCPKLCVP